MNSISLLNWMLLSTALLGAWWLCYRLALRGERSFGYNRAFLVLGPLVAAGLPLLPVAWPVGWGAAPATLLGVANVLLPAVEVRAPGAATEAAAVDWAFWLGAGYAVGVFLLLGRLGLSLVRLWWATRALPRETAPDYILLRTGGRLPTSSFGRVVLWDETLPLSAAEARQVLRHELAHVRQGHTYDRLLLEVLGAVLWFNPFVHLCSRALVLTHEYLADAAALHDAAAPAVVPADSYAHLLARQVAARLGFAAPIAHSFSHSQTLRRIAMIQKASSVRRWKQWLVLPLFGALLFTVACERANEATPPVAPAASAEQLAPPPPPPSLAPPSPPALDKVFTYVEQMPELPGGGGNRAIVEFIQGHMVYPADLPAAERVDGTVFVQFTVDKHGDVDPTSVQLVKALTAPYNTAVVRAVAQLPRFSPGRQRFPVETGEPQPVAVSFTVPIRFAWDAAPSK